MTLLRNRRLLTKLSLLLGLFLVLTLLVSGCSTRGMSPVGWSGVVISEDGQAYTGSREGRLVSVRLSDGTRYFADPLKVPSTGGSCMSTGSSSSSAFGCGGTTPVVAIYGTPALADGVPIGLDNNGDQINGRIAIIAGYNGSVIAYQSNAMANIVWQFTVPSTKNYTIVSGVTVSNGLAYFGCSDGYVYALDVKGDLASRTTTVAWTFSTGNFVWATPQVSEGILVVGSFDKKIYGLNALTGEKIWEHATGANNIASPLIADGMVYVGSLDSRFYGLDLQSGREVWTYKADNWFWAQAVMANGIVYAPCLDRNVYALNPRTGEKIGVYNLNGQISSTPVVVGNKVVIATQSGTLWTLDAADTAAAAKQVADIPEDVSSALTARGDVIYFNAVDTQKQSENKLYGYNLAENAFLSPVPLNY